MSWSAQLESESDRVSHGPECGVRVFLDRIADEDRVDVEDAMKRRATIKTSVLARAILRDFGVHVSASSLTRHRNGECKCARRS